MAADIPVFLYSFSADRYPEEKFFVKNFFCLRKKIPLRLFIIGKTMRDEKKNETGYFVCGAYQNETG